ncbi:hypothetical protein LSCM1_01506 [Leishmania martiniquensis]|uniref:Uncharacterized protein n=1 Tax=Leishmania martiniquensis TaxID=1580590 RepID=A0A836GDE2_9TRYP|nr:hypothetical protein LSCM1_01506 [Leishmania martiniquensis]
MSVSIRSPTSATCTVGEPIIAAVASSPAQERLVKSDRIPRLLSEPMQRSPFTNAEAKESDVPSLLSGDDPAVAYSSSIISSHEASFYSSLKVSRADNLDGLEGCATRVGHGFVSTPTGASAEKYVSEHRPSAGPRLFTPKRPLTQHSAEFHGTEAESAPHAAAKAASERRTPSEDTGKAEKLGEAGACPQSISASEKCSRSSQPRSPHSRLMSPAGEVKTLQELLEWRAHLSAWKESLETQGGSNLHGTNGTKKGVRRPQEGGAIPAGPLHGERAPGSVQPTIAMAEMSSRSPASPRTEAFQGCRIGMHGTPTAPVSPPAKTESHAAGADFLAAAQLARSRHSHTSSGAVNQTEPANDSVTKSSVGFSSQPRSPMRMEERHLSSAQQHAQLEQHLSLHENLVTQVSPTARVTISTRGGREGVGTGRSGRPSGAGSPVLSSLRCLEGVGPEDHAFSPGHERRPWARGALPPAVHTPLSVYPSQGCGFDGYRSRDNRSSPYPGSGKSTISSGGIQRQHSRDASSPLAPPRTPQSRSHKMKVVPPAMKLRELGAEDEVPVFAVPIDEETNKAVVGFVSALVLLICLVFICAM